MPCHLVTFDPQTRTRTEYDCDEPNTAKVVEDDHAGKATGTYSDLSGKSFQVDWSRIRLVSFTRKRDDGSVVLSGDAEGCQTPPV